MAAPPFPESTLTLTSLQDPTTPALLDIRPFLARLGRGASYDIFVQVQQAFDSLQNTFRDAAPSLDQLTIASADIGDLTVGSQYGPGQLTVLNGPPDYNAIGWIGSQNSAVAVNITNIVAGLATTAAPHGLKVGDITLIAATTNVLHNGYFVVATTPLATTFTATGVSGGSTGGTSTRQFQGGWLRTLAVGGTNFADAHFIADVDGSLTITDALIVLNGAGGATITLDPSVPSFVLDDGVSFSVTISPAVGGVQVGSTAGGNDTHSRMTPDSFFIFNNSGLLNVSLKSNSSIHDGRLSIYSSAGLGGGETFFVLGEDGSFTSLGSGAALGMDLDNGTAPTAGQFTVKASALGMFSILTYAADNVNIGFDVDWASSGWKARNASVIVQRKNSAKLSFLGSTGNSVGSAATLNSLAALDISNGFWGVGGNISPAYAIDATGDVNASGVFRKGGTAGLSTTIATAKLTGGGFNGSMTFSGGILTASTPAT